MNPDLLSKLQKVLALAKRGGTEAEMQTAMRLAQEILAKHNLTLDDVETAQETPEEVESEKCEATNRQSWQDIIWASIAKLYFTETYSQNLLVEGKAKKHYILVGRASNIAVTKAIVGYIIPLAQNLSKTACKGGGGR